MYIEGRGKKILAKSTVKRAVDKLVKKGLLIAEETSFGTLFTIVNAEDLKYPDGVADFFVLHIAKQMQNNHRTKYRKKRI